MRVATLALAAALVAGAAADAAAHGRGFVPFFGGVVIVPAPVAPGKNQITVPGPPQPPGASAGAHARGEPTMPSRSPGFEFRLHRGHHLPPPPEPVPATSDGALGRAPARVGGSGQSFTSAPAGSAGALGRAPARVGGGSGQSFSSQTGMTARQDDQLLFSRGGVIETPIVIILE
jgi:hypothetical protein